MTITEHRKHLPRDWPERTGSDCYDWMTPEDAVRLALGSYYGLCRQLRALRDDPHGIDALFNNGRQCFARNIAELFQLRVMALGFASGAPGFETGYAEAAEDFLILDDDEFLRQPRVTREPTPQVFSDSAGLNIPTMGDTQSIHRAQCKGYRQAARDRRQAAGDTQSVPCLPAHHDAGPSNRQADGAMGLLGWSCGQFRWGLWLRGARWLVFSFGLWGAGRYAVQRTAHLPAELTQTLGLFNGCEDHLRVHHQHERVALRCGVGHVVAPVGGTPTSIDNSRLGPIRRLVSGQPTKVSDDF